MQSHDVETAKRQNSYISAGPTAMPTVVEPLPLSISVESITSTIKQYAPPKKQKYDTNHKIDAVYGQYRQMETTGQQLTNLSSFYHKMIFAFYDMYKPQVRSIVKRYKLLSPVYDESDLQQTAIEAIMGAIHDYDYRKESDMKFSTFLDWKIRNKFQRVLGTKDKYVEIYKNGHLTETIDYHSFITRKRSLQSAGYTYIIKSRLCQLSSIIEEKASDKGISESLVSAQVFTNLEEHDRSEEAIRPLNIEGPALDDEQNDIGDEPGCGNEDEQIDNEPAVCEAKCREQSNIIDSMDLINEIHRNYISEPDNQAPESRQRAISAIAGIYEGHIQKEAEGVLPGEAVIPELLKKFLIRAIETSIEDYTPDTIPGTSFALHLRASFRTIVKKGGKTGCQKSH